MPTIVGILTFNKHDRFRAQSLRCCNYHANNVKLSTIVGILTFMRMINFVLSLSDIVLIMLIMLKCQHLLAF